MKPVCYAYRIRPPMIGPSPLHTNSCLSTLPFPIPVIQPEKAILSLQVCEFARPPYRPSAAPGTDRQKYQNTRREKFKTSAVDSLTSNDRVVSAIRAPVSIKLGQARRQTNEFYRNQLNVK